jgi:chromosome segregation ATPase
MADLRPTSTWEIQKLRDQAAQTEQTLASRTAEAQQLRDRLASAERELASATVDRDQLRAEARNAQHALSVVTAERDEIRDTVRRTQQALLELTTERDQFRVENLNLKGNVAELQRARALAASTGSLDLRGVSVSLFYRDNVAREAVEIRRRLEGSGATFIKFENYAQMPSNTSARTVYYHKPENLTVAVQISDALSDMRVTSVTLMDWHPSAPFVMWLE